tara:strand:- start:1460 stop:1588 length:129 start_codon:yes stop_codon:yes gene_type:complete
MPWKRPTIKQMIINEINAFNLNTDIRIKRILIDNITINNGIL